MAAAGACTLEREAGLLCRPRKGAAQGRLLHGRLLLPASAGGSRSSTLRVCQQCGATAAAAASTLPPEAFVLSKPRKGAAWRGLRGRLLLFTSAGGNHSSTLQVFQQRGAATAAACTLLQEDVLASPWLRRAAQRLLLHGCLLLSTSVAGSPGS
jgi:hypothetical protein